MVTGTGSTSKTWRARDEIVQVSEWIPLSFMATQAIKSLIDAAYVSFVKYVWRKLFVNVQIVLYLVGIEIFHRWKGEVDIVRKWTVSTSFARYHSTVCIPLSQFNPFIQELWWGQGALQWAVRFHGQRAENQHFHKCDWMALRQTTHSQLANLSFFSVFDLCAWSSSWYVRQREKTQTSAL